MSARVWNAVLGCSLKNDRMNSVCFRRKPFNTTVIQVYAPTANTKKKVLFIIGDWNAKVGSQEILGLIWPWSTKWSRAKVKRVLPRECTGHNRHPLPITQERTLHMDITRWSTTKSDWLYSLHPKMEKLYTVNRNKTRSWLWLRSWTPYCQIQT